MAIIGASLLLLDFAATAVTSALTAIAYLTGEVVTPFPAYVGVLIAFVLFTAISLAGLKESARVASGVLSFHVGYQSMGTSSFSHVTREALNHDSAVHCFCHFLDIFWILPVEGKPGCWPGITCGCS